MDIVILVFIMVFRRNRLPDSQAHEMVLNIGRDAVLQVAEC